MHALALLISAVICSLTGLRHELDLPLLLTSLNTTAVKCVPCISWNTFSLISTSPSSTTVTLATLEQYYSTRHHINAVQISVKQYTYLRRSSRAKSLKKISICINLTFQRFVFRIKLPFCGKDSMVNHRHYRELSREQTM